MTSIVQQDPRAKRTAIDNTSIEDKRLSWDCKGLLLFLTSRPEGEEIDLDPEGTQIEALAAFDKEVLG